MELRELAHTISVDILTIWNAVIRIFVTLTLVLGLLVIVFLIIAALVQKRRIGVVKDVL